MTYTHEELKAMKPLTDAEKKLAWNSLRAGYLKLNRMLDGIKVELKLQQRHTPHQ